MSAPSTIQLTFIKPVLCIGHYLVQREKEEGEEGKRNRERGERMEERDRKNLYLKQYTLASGNNSK